MAQFEFYLLFVIVISLIISLNLNYLLIINVILPKYCGLLKFRYKMKNQLNFKLLKLNKILIFEKR